MCLLCWKSFALSFVLRGRRLRALRAVSPSEGCTTQATPRTPSHVKNIDWSSFALRSARPNEAALAGIIAQAPLDELCISTV